MTSSTDKLRYVRRNFDEAAILAVAAKVAFESYPDLTDSDLATVAAMRRAHPSVGPSHADLQDWLSGMDPNQILGVVSNTKGVFHEMEFVELENGDGDSVYASLFPSTNNPGFDVEFINRTSGETWAAQLKATDSSAYVQSWIESHPDDQILVTEELATEMGLPSSGLPNEELTVRTESLVDTLIDAEDGANIWAYLPGLTAVSISLVVWELFQRHKSGDISAAQFRQMTARAAGLKGVKIAGLTLLMAIPGINVVTGAALVYSLIFSAASVAKQVDGPG